MIQRGLRLLVDTVSAWSEDGGPQLSAAIAYYTVLSLAPLLILAGTIAGLVVEADSASAMRNELSLLLGDRGADFALSLIDEAGVPGQGLPLVLLNATILVIGSTVVFANVQTALNRIWGIRRVKGGVLGGLVRQRLVAFVMMTATGIILVCSVVLGSVVGLMSDRIGSGGGTWALLWLIEAGLSIMILAVMFGATFRILPDGNIAWQDAVIGAFVTAMLFVFGKTAVSVYLTRVPVIDAYGAAGSLVFVLLWVYYSAAIYFLGAEFTKLWGLRCGRSIQPRDGAVLIKTESRR